ncbi:cilia- and flagella-associated protein 251 isoform X2 [Toxotes jaculatrix]|uniref:cilia- and flagella-associated protein 251 isoform X2 n=1 Tax=Toxotes jaculatrix TaxID=941984 RepID=UPI001B3AEC49|nr:cilia- and flagella-associated protein 251 isoform X2 [Toxotes jaculatrix]
MEQSLSDLLSDAFSETCVPSFPDEDLDFDKLDFDEMFEEDKTDISHENIPTEEDKSLHQEAMGETAVLSRMETKDMHKVENTDPEQYDEENDEEDFQGVDVGLASMDRTPEEDYTSSDGDSEQEDSVSGEDEEDEEEDTDTGVKPGDLLMSACSSYEFCCDNKEDRIFAEGQPPAPEGDENPQVRNEEQGEGESNEEVSYFGRVPECGNEMMIKGDVTEEDEQEGDEEKREDSSDSECEGMKVEQEENVAQRFEQDVENPYRCAPAADTLEFQERSVQNLQDLIVEADSEEDAEEVKDFSGEEHQEAGESFADYPSDFSSCEYVEDRVKHPECNFQSNALPHTSDSGSDAQQNICLEGAVTDITWMRSEEGTEEEGDEYLYSRDLEMEAEKFRSFDLAAGEKYRGKTEAVENVLGNAAVTGCVDVESDSYSSSDDEAQVRKRDEELVDSMCLQDPENDKKLEDTWLYSTSSSAFSMWSISDDQPITNNRENPPDLSTNWDFEVSKTAFALCGDLSTTEDIQTETPLSSVSQRPAESNNSYSVVQRDDHKTTSPSYQGSLDDSFFFNTELEASGITELGQLGDDEYEDERNWEQEQERIKAFYEFYDSEGENEREERQIKVQFCTDPLSQVIHYETDSDRDSLSSSTDRDEDLSSTETSEELREPDDNTLQMIPACDPPNTQLPESVPENDVSNTQICTRKHKCLGMLKLMLKMGLVIGVGLLTFWLATDQPDWFSQASFFQG